MKNNMYDTIIVGGSYAGLSAGLALARFRRSVLIIDDGNPCNKDTRESHNFVAHDGESPSSILQTIKSQLQDYATVDFLGDHVSETRAFKNHFSAVLHSKKIIHAKKLLLACGIKDKLPLIDGFQSCWGVSIVDCPYCHGYEFRDKRAIVLGSLRKAKKMVTLLRSLHTEIGIIEPSEPQKNRNKEIQGLDNFEIDNSYSTIKSIQHKNGLVHSIHLQHGQSQLVDIIYAPRPFKLRGDLHVQLGCKQTKHGYIRVNKKQQTSVHNVYACGDNSNLLRSISSAVYSGTKAGMMINKALAKESRSGKT